LVDETTYLLAEYYAALSTSIAFPELALPAIVALRRASKKAAASGGQSRLAALLKQLVEKLESNSTWVENRREKVEFAPNKRDKVDRFLAAEPVERTPLGTHVKLLAKQRDARKATMDRAVRSLLPIFSPLIRHSDFSLLVTADPASRGHLDDTLFLSLFQVFLVVACSPCKHFLPFPSCPSPLSGLLLAPTA
jgi:hypothetical protein